VIAGQINDARAFARLPQKLLHDVVMILWPIPALTSVATIDDIADQVDRVGIVIAEEVEELLGLAATARDARRK